VFAKNSIEVIVLAIIIRRAKYTKNYVAEKNYNAPKPDVADYRHNFSAAPNPASCIPAGARQFT